MLDLNLLKKDLHQCNQDLDIHIKVLEEYLHGESFLKVNTFCRQKGDEIQFNYHSNLKPQFIFVRDCLKILFSLCLKIKSPGTQSVDIFDLSNEINKSLFIDKTQKIYLISIIEQSEHEIKKHNRLGKEFILLTQKIENKIDTVKLLNCFIDEKYVINENSQSEPLKDFYDLINGIFDEYKFWEKPLEGVSELGDLNYTYCPISKKSLNRDHEIWSELIKLTYSDNGQPFLDLYTQIQIETGRNDPTFPDLKKRKTSHSESSH